MDSLFSDAQLDQDLLKLEKKREEREKERLAKEKAQNEDKKSEEKDKIFEKKLFIVDGYSLIYRSYFAFITRPLSNNKGENISAFYGFFNTVLMLLREYTFDYFVIALDSHAPTFRHIMYPEYKANRDSAPEDLHAQVPKIVDALKQMNIPHVAEDGMEADDLIATLVNNAKRLEIDSVIVTGDKDLLQLVDNHVSALRPPKRDEKNYRLYKEQEVEEEYGVKPTQIVDYLSLLGDSSDNVPGVKGIGEKGAVKLLAEFVTLDGIYRHLDSLSKGLKQKLVDGKESAYLSKDLIILKDDCFTIDSFDTSDYNTSTINYAKAAELFGAENCIQLARRALDMANGDKKQFKKEIEEKKKEEVQVREVDKELLGLGKYKAITDLKELSQRFEEVYRKDGILAFDTETTSTEIEEAELVGFSFSSKEKNAYYVPIITNGEKVISIDDVLPIFKEYIESGKLKLVGQNIKYDMQILAKYGIEVKEIIFDTMIASWLLDSNAGSYNMDYLANKYLHYETLKFSDVVKKGDVFSNVDLDTAVKYAAEDADITYRLYKAFSKELKDKNLDKIYYEMEMPLIKILSSMETKGILVDKEKLSSLSLRMNAELDKIRNDIYEIAGKEFNINSTQQLSVILFEERGLPSGKKTKSGYSTDIATLEGLKHTKDPIIAKLLSYRSLAKLLSTYIDAFPLLIKKDGRIHTSYLQTGTATGRLSSKNPNLQNIPIRTDEGRLIRDAFISEKGHTFLSADYAQIELVVLAELSGDESLKEAFIKGEDVHRYTAALIFNKNREDITSDERRVAKTINFGIMYGMSAFRLSNELDISRTEAKEFIDRYFIRYHKVRDFVAKAIKEAEDNGEVKTLFGHVRPVLGINSANKTEKAAADRVAVNTIIQGTAAELMKKAMINIFSRMEKENLESSLLLQVHDELIFEVKDSEKDVMLKLVKEEMENAIKFSIPIRASLETALSWGEMH